MFASRFRGNSATVDSYYSVGPLFCFLKAALDENGRQWVHIIIIIIITRARRIRLTVLGYARGSIVGADSGSGNRVCSEFSRRELIFSEIPADYL
jgi:hypothetical protein